MAQGRTDTRLAPQTYASSKRLSDAVRLLTTASRAVLLRVPCHDRLLEGAG